jgi:N-acetylneuraminic acid mutarotase
VPGSRTLRLPIIACLAPPLLICAAACAHTVSGTVTNQQGNPVADVLMRWRGPRGQATETVTDVAGFYRVNLPTNTAVRELDGTLPTENHLFQNYPNPFNPGTVIPLTVSGANTEMTLIIYSALGQRVRLLADGRLSRGLHEIYWDGRDDGGRAAASGVYIYRLTTGRSAHQRSMVLVDGGGSSPGGAGKQAALTTLFEVGLSGDSIVDRTDTVWVADEAVETASDFIVDQRFVWTAKSPMPTRRQEITAAVWRGRIFVFGGLDDQANSLDLVSAYEPRSDSWEVRHAMPMGLDHLSAATVGDRIYITGGYDRANATRAISRQTLEYDPGSDSWSRRADMPFPRGAHGTAVVGGRIYVVGGLGPTSRDQAMVMVYDPRADSWDTGAPMPIQSEHLAVSAVAERVLAISGRFKGILVDVQIYDPRADTWESRAPIPTPRSGIAAIAWMGAVYVFGGELPGVFADNEAYDLGADSWTQAPPMPTARHGLAAGLVDGKFYLIGGGTVAGLRATDAVEEYVP